MLGVLSPTSSHVCCLYCKCVSVGCWGDHVRLRLCPAGFGKEEALKRPRSTNPGTWMGKGIVSC